MPSVYIPIIILGTVIPVIIFFIVKNFAMPKKSSTLAGLVKQGKFSAAIRVGKQVTAKDPRNAEAHYYLGQSYLGEGRPELALMELKKVNEIGNFEGYCREADFRNQLSQLFMQFNQQEEALKEQLLLVKLEPKVAQHYYFVGGLFEGRNNTEKATDFFRKAIELDPKHSEAHYRLGQILYRGKHPVEAKAELEAAIQYDSENYKAFYYLGRILKENHDYVGALLSFEKAQRDPSLKIKTLVERGSCYISLNTLDKAVNELERANRLISNEASTEALYSHYFLSLCYEKMRQFDKAVEQWEKVYARNPSFRDVAEKLSQYQDLRVDDRMKDFLTASQDNFQEICKEIVNTLELSPRDIQEIPNGCQIIAVEHESKWRASRTMPQLIRAYRIPEMLDLSTIRAVHEDMKKMNVMRGIVIASTRFSRSAVEFAETRPIELIDKEKLQKLLQKVTTMQDSKSR